MFPGFREFSLVVLVGNHRVQGGTSASFITTGSGTLSLCLNTNDIYSNITGGGGITVAVDETAAP
jgi:hypothetical protein